MTSYKQLLRDPRWQRKRLEIFERDNWTCVVCGAKDVPLAVHHLVYRKLAPWLYPDHLYQTLCENCHSFRQELTDKATDALRIRLATLGNAEMEAETQWLIAAALNGEGGQ